MILGIIFGEAVNNEENAKTILALMIVCLCGGPRFFAKIYPVCKVKSDFQSQVAEQLCLQIEEAGGHPLGLVMNNAKVNQKTMKILNFKCGSERNEQFLCYRGENIKPFYLLNDTVHILKTIRNSWITEKTKTLEYKLPGEDAVRFAEWKFIVSLLETDCGIVKMSPLTNK